MFKKRIISITLLLALVIGLLPVLNVSAANETYRQAFPDANFRQYVLTTVIKGGADDSIITDAEKATMASWSSMDIGAKSIADLTGIEYFTGLTYLNCTGNQLTALDVSKNTALVGLSCNGNRLTALDVSRNTALTNFSCTNNQLTALDVSINTALEWLYCNNNQLTALDVSKNTALIYLACYDNQLTVLDVSKNTALIKIWCDRNRLTALDVSKNTALMELLCTNNQLTALDVSKNSALGDLQCQNNQLTALDVSKNTALERLYCHNNRLTALEVSKNTALTMLTCNSNRLTTLDVSKNTALTQLYCQYNNMGSDPDVSVIGWRNHWQTASNSPAPFWYYPQNTVPQNHVPVTSITGVPTTATSKMPLTLTGTVNPSNATNKTITWSVVSAGTTGATISGSTLNTTAKGTVTVRATVTNGKAAGTNYTQDFTITVSDSLIPVTSITGVPTTATAKTPLTLTGTVNPSNATNKTITWSVVSAGTTGATISGSTLNTMAAGTVTVRATVVNGKAAGTNYTQDFTITVKNSGSDPFAMGEDNYRFINTRASFGYSSNYRIPFERFKEIFTPSLAQYYYNSKEYNLWRGSCFGFSASSYALEDHKLRPSDYQSGARLTYDFAMPGTPNSPVTKLIELYQISQSLPSVWAELTSKQRYNNLPALVSATNNEDGLIVCIWGVAGGHAVIAYGIESLGGNKYSLKIYDNNQPNNTNLRLEVDLTKTGSSAWAFNAADTQDYNFRIGRDISFISGETIYNEVQRAKTNKSTGTYANNMQLVAPENAQITSAGGVDVQNIADAYEIVPLGVLPLNPDGSDPTPRRTSELWCVPVDEYKIAVNGTDNVSISAMNGDSAYTVNLSPSGNSMIVEIGDVVNIEGAVHGNVTEYRDDGAALVLPVVAASSDGLTLGSGSEASFSDVQTSNWYNSAVTSVATVGIVEGVGGNRFDPQGVLTVAQFVTMLMRTQHGRLSGTGTWYSAYIEQAERDGILYASDKLDPTANITRAQAALIVTRYVEKFNPDWAKSRVTNTPDDLKDVPVEYRSAVEKAYSWNIIQGDDNNKFNPNKTLTRAESAQVLYNYYSIVD